MNDKTKGKLNQKALLTGIVMLVAVLFFTYKVVSFFMTPMQPNQSQNQQLEQYWQWKVDNQNKINNN